MLDCAGNRGKFIWFHIRSKAGPNSFEIIAVFCSGDFVNLLQRFFVDPVKSWPALQGSIYYWNEINKEDTKRRLTFRANDGKNKSDAFASIQCSPFISDMTKPHLSEKDKRLAQQHHRPHSEINGIFGASFRYLTDTDYHLPPMKITTWIFLMQNSFSLTKHLIDATLIHFCDRHLLVNFPFNCSYLFCASVRNGKNRLFNLFGVHGWE